MLENSILKISKSLKNEMIQHKWEEVLYQSLLKGLKPKPNRKSDIANGMLSNMKMMRIFRNMPLNLRKFIKE